MTDDKTCEFTPAPQSEDKSDPQLDPAETLVDSEYAGHRIVRPHAKGGMGKVSIALDENLKREVALKELFEHAAGNDTTVRRFLDEAEITARLEHPGIVPVHAFGLDSHGRPFYTMKLIRGKTLQQAIKDYHRVWEMAPEKHAALRDLLRRFASVCQTMGFAHERGILHRDLKPSNIMLGEHGETLVMDWGLAKPMEEGDDVTAGEVSAEKVDSRLAQTESGKVIGTPAYMSPEQASGEQGTMGPRSDIYSLGAILYQILTDETPFSGKSSDEIIRKVLAEQPHRVTEMNRFAPKALEAIAMRALARDPKERYSDAGALYRDVMNWLDDEPLEARPDTRYDKLWRWMRKNRALATTVFVSALLLITILGAAGVILQHARTQTVAAQMMAAEMKQRADTARQQAKQPVAELKIKEKELAETKAALAATASDDAIEKSRLRKRIEELTSETGTLRTKITRLQTLAADFDGNEVNVLPEPLPDETYYHCEIFDIIRMVKQGQIRVVGYETILGSIPELMDFDYRSQHRRAAVSRDAGQAVLTFVFARPQKITGLNFNYIQGLRGSIQVETADSIQELEKKNGSYSVRVPETPLVPTGDSYCLNAIHFAQPTEMRILRLTVRSTGNMSGICLQDFRLWGFPNYEEVAEPMEINFETKDLEDGTGVELVRYHGNDAEVVIPQKVGGKPVVRIGEYAFRESRARSITTPDTVTFIDTHAFWHCPALQKIYISKSVTKVGEWFVDLCPALEICEIDNGEPRKSPPFTQFFHPRKLFAFRARIDDI